jgi:hypothetical protein
MATELEIHIQTYIDYLLSHPCADDDAVVDAMAQEGIGHYRALELVIWVPMALAHAMLEGPDLTFPRTFRLMSEDGQKFTRRKLSDEPVYVETRRISTSKGISRKDFAVIARRSSEFNAINNALFGGSRLQDLVLSETVVLFPGYSPTSGENTKRPWWKFW